MTDTAHIEALWIEPGTPFDAACAANLHRPRDQYLSPDDIMRIWKKATAEGRLPNFVRPWNGFKPNQAEILRRLMTLGIKKVAS